MADKITNVKIVSGPTEPGKEPTKAPETTETTEPKPTEKKKRKRWLPLESNIELMNKYIYGLGVTTQWEFHDVLGVEDFMLEMVPQPISALLLLFPISKMSEEARKEEDAKVKKDGQTVSKNVYHTLQTVGNACGTVGLIHAILNNKDIQTDEKKFFAKFYAETKDMTAEQRAEALENNSDIEVEHQAVATEAKSDVSHASNDNLHFICFVHVDGNLYELDGRKKFPINHGKTTPRTLLADAVVVVKQFMARDPTDIRFAMTALAKTGPAPKAATTTTTTTTTTSPAAATTSSTSDGADWVCSSCTLLNLGIDSTCATCGVGKKPTK